MAGTVHSFFVGGRGLRQTLGSLGNAQRPLGRASTLGTDLVGEHSRELGGPYTGDLNFSRLSWETSTLITTTENPQILVILCQNEARGNFLEPSLTFQKQLCSLR